MEQCSTLPAAYDNQPCLSGLSCTDHAPTMPGQTACAYCESFLLSGVLDVALHTLHSCNG